MSSLAGKTIKGYILQERIGGGAFGDVYKAYQGSLPREVAIKYIPPKVSNKVDFVRRFEIESQLVAKLEHPFIVPLYDCWRDPDGAYMVMRLLRGGSLLDLLRAHGKLNIEDTVMAVNQVAQALHVAHRNQVVHRDIKPGNILLDEDNNAYLADFGIAKDHTLPTDLTDIDSIVGTLDYIAPEQARSEPVTPQSDIYSLGVVLYEMLEGQHPFPNLTPVERLYRHLDHPLPEVDQLDDAIHDAVNQVIQKATAKDPMQRFKDVMDMAQALQEAAALNQSQAGSNPVELLTPREQEVLQLIIDGKSNRQIAEKLVLTLGTVKTYVTRIYKKLNVRSRQQAAVKARELKLVFGRADSVAASSMMSAMPEPENPYKGLRAFGKGDSHEFFGRERFVQKLMGRLQEHENHSRFLAVVGPSGSGKSSVVKAGLIPALWRGEIEGSDNWYIVEMIPNMHPIDKLETTLFTIATDKSINIHEQLIRDERGLVRVADMILPDDGSELFLLIDQFDETFTIVESEQERLQILKLIQEAVTNKDSRVRVVVTLRADYYDRPLQYPDFGELMRTRIETILPLSADELEHAIHKPAEQVGVTFEEGLVSRIVSDVHYQPGALPLLQYALTELFERREGRILTLEAYQAIGGTGGALAKRADDIYQEYDETGRELIRQMFLRLVTLGEGAEDTRRRIERSELLVIASDDGDLMDEIIDTYATSRLLSLDNDPATRHPTVEVAHEAILREWDRLRQWLNESREDIRQERLIAQAAEDWISSDRDTSYLYQGNRLEQSQAWRGMTSMSLTPQETDFLNTSMKQERLQEQERLEQEKREKQQEAKSRQLLSALVAVFALAAILSGGFGIFALNARDAEADARTDAELAEQEALRQASIGLASIALSELEDGHQDQAVLIALEALEDYPYTSQAESALADAVEAYIPYMSAGQRSWRSYSWSVDGEQIAFGGSKEFASSGALDDAIVIASNQNVDLNYVEMSLGLPGCTTRDMVWSPQDDLLVSTYMRGEYSTDPCLALPTVWDIKSGEQLVQFDGHGVDQTVLSADWSPDGQVIATAGDDGNVRLWDAYTGEELLVISDHDDDILDVRWSPSNRQLATASRDGTAKIWDATTGNLELTISGLHTDMTAVDWSPDGTKFVTASGDGVARVWGVETGDLLLALIGHDGALVGVSYDPDGQRIATVSNVDGSARIWDANNGELRLVFPGFGIEVYDVVWSSDGSQFTVNGPRHQRIWDVSQQPLQLSGHTARIQDGEWSPDGTLIATVSFDHTARIWDAKTGEELHVLDHGNQVWHLDWSPDGTRIATASSGGVARVWDVYTGDLLVEVQASPPDVVLFSVRWSPDGNRVVTGDLASHDTVFDPNTGEILAVLDYETARASLGEDNNCILFGPSWSPDSSKIATGCPSGGDRQGTGVLVWDAANGDLLQSFESLYQGAARTDWSADGETIATASGSLAAADGTITLWDADSGALQGIFSGHTAYTYGLSWSPDGSRIASGDMTGIVKVWNPITSEEVRSFQVPGIIINVHWSPDGTYLMATGEFTPPVIRRVWSSSEALIDYAYDCCVTRELTSEERQQYGLPES